MRLLTFQHESGPRPAVSTDGRTGIDLRVARPDLPPAWPELFGHLETIRTLVEHPDRDLPRFDLGQIQLLPPVLRPGKIIAVGRNYREHASEQGAKVPRAPLLFSKAPTCLQSHDGPILLDADLDQVDAEAELAVVIGRAGRAVPQDRAAEHVAGYTCFNDVSDRAAQFADKQWFRGKSIDTGGPCGPWIVTPEELPPLADGLVIRCLWNGRVMQEDSTGNLIFTVDQLISYASSHMTLLPGDIIATGTPAGVGVFRDPPIFLRPGDLVEVEIDRVGRLANPVRAR